MSTKVRKATHRQLLALIKKKAVGADTPVGPVRFEYGVALHGRNAVFVRLGRWF